MCNQLTVESDSSGRYLIFHDEQRDIGLSGTSKSNDELDLVMSTLHVSCIPRRDRKRCTKTSSCRRECFADGHGASKISPYNVHLEAMMISQSSKKFHFYWRLRNSPHLFPFLFENAHSFSRRASCRLGGFTSNRVEDRLRELSYVHEAFPAV